jgi:beta-mannosidase
MNSHQRCLADERRDKEYGNRLIQNYIERWYHVPKNFELYLYVSQVLQAEGVRAAMEAHRRAMPYCMGSLYWQINDCWPVASWSSIDYYGRWKALHYTARNSFAQILISPDISEDKIKIYVVSDQQKDTEATLDITAITFNGKKIFNNSVSIKVKANSSECATTLEKQQIVGEEDQSRLILITVLKNGEKILAQNISYFKSPKELQLEKPKYSVNITKSETGYNVELTANTLAKNVYLTCGDVKEFVSDNYFDLLPDMKKIIMISTDLGKKEFERRLKIVSLVDSYE